MASPILNEALIASMLGTEPVAASAEYLRTAALMIIIDAYDRKIEREEFITAAKSAVQLIEMMGRLESVTGVHASFTSQHLTAERLEEAIRVLTSNAETNRVSLAHFMERLIQCSEDGQTIN